MNYYYDCEFLEGTQDKKILGIKVGKTKPTIDLISIGIVSEDNREYYAISKDFNLRDAWNRYDEKIETMYGDMRNRYPEGRKYKEYWIRENVLRPIFDELWNRFWREPDYLGIIDMKFTYDSLKYLIEKYGKSNKQIAFEVLNFAHGHNDMGNWLGITEEYYNAMIAEEPKDKPKFYGYYSAYDHVVLCWLFGKMKDLPKGFPMYTIDLKQTLDEVAQTIPESFSIELGLISLKLSEGFPKETNYHNALADAKWNKELHKFLLSLK